MPIIIIIIIIVVVVVVGRTALFDLPYKIL
jgi:hypothetical protein